MKRKVFIIFLIFILFITFFYSFAMADGGAGFVQQIDTTADTNASNSAKNILKGILAVVRAVGATTAVVILVVIGTKYMLASAGDRADIKKYAVKYIIGAVILFAASGLLKLVQNIVDTSVQV